MRYSYAISNSIAARYIGTRFLFRWRCIWRHTLSPVNIDVSKESLEDFEIGLFCTPPCPGSTIDYETQDQISTRKVSITPGDQRGIVHLVEDGVVYDDKRSKPLDQQTSVGLAVCSTYQK